MNATVTIPVSLIKHKSRWEDLRDVKITNISEHDVELSMEGSNYVINIGREQLLAALQALTVISDSTEYI